MRIEVTIHLIRSFVIALPLARDSFDCVVCAQVAEHIPSDPAIFNELI